jgi:hypothetical protein
VFSRFASLCTVSGIALGRCALTVAPADAVAATAYLNTYNPANTTNTFCSGANLLPPITPPGCGSSAQAPVILSQGIKYDVTVVGAVSIWGGWPRRRCGKREPRSQFASPGIANMPAGDDAQFRFARPLDRGECGRLPEKTAFFQVDLGSGWFHPVANGNPSKPSGDDEGHDQHPYTFTFTGEGLEPQFRFIDYHSSDNSGRFKIVVSRS